MDASRWSDDGFLDGLRQSGDAEADATVARLIEAGGIEAANLVFKNMHADGVPFGGDCPEPLAEFFEATNRLPAGTDLDRLESGAEAFLEESATACVVLLASSLPQGYAAPSLCQILTISGNLQNHPYKRLLGVIQLLVNLCTPGAFRPGGLAVVTAQKLRLLHAGVRYVAPRHRPEFRERFGVPVNHEDMLATIMAFSWLVIDGFRTLKVRFPDEDDFYEVWRTFALMMGIHPPGRPDDVSLVPESVDAAAAFYRSYARRNFTGAEDNPSGPDLARENLEMMESMIPMRLRKLGLNHAPRIAMTELLTAEALARIEIEPLRGHRLLRKLLGEILEAVDWVSEIEPSVTEILARALFRHMIRRGRGGEVSFVIPDSLASLRGDGLV